MRLGVDIVIIEIYTGELKIKTTEIIYNLKQVISRNAEEMNQTPGTTRSRSNERVRRRSAAPVRNDVAEELRRKLKMSEAQAAHIATRSRENEELWDRRVDELERNNELYSEQVNHLVKKAQEY